MKIGFVFDDSLDRTDGVQQYILSLSSWLRAHDHEVHFLVGETHRTDLLHVHSLSRNITVEFNGNRLSTPRPASRRAIATLLTEEQFDVLHVQLPYSPLLAGRVIQAAPATTAVVGTFHILPFKKRERLAAQLLGLLLHRSLKRFDRVFAVSAPAAHFAAQTFGVQSTVLPNVVNVATFAAAKPLPEYTEGLTIVFLGRLVERKGCLQLLQALHQLQQQSALHDVRVLVCSDGPQRASLERYVQEHALNQVVEFLGFIDEADKARYLASADLAVFPSIAGESFGIVLIEAMAAGSTVVLGGNNPGYSSVLGDRPKQLFDPNNTPVFADTLQYFMKNATARKQAHHWQQTAVQQYDVRLVATALLNSYKEVLQTRRAVR